MHKTRSATLRSKGKKHLYNANDNDEVTFCNRLLEPSTKENVKNITAKNICTHCLCILVQLVVGGKPRAELHTLLTRLMGKPPKKRDEVTTVDLFIPDGVAFINDDDENNHLVHVVSEDRKLCNGKHDTRMKHRKVDPKGRELCPSCLRKLFDKLIDNYPPEGNLPVELVLIMTEHRYENGKHDYWEIHGSPMDETFLDEHGNSYIDRVVKNLPDLTNRLRSGSTSIYLAQIVRKSIIDISFKRGHWRLPPVKDGKYLKLPKA